MNSESVSRDETVEAAPGPDDNGSAAAADVALRTINTIRFLAADAVEKANSGHPGMPMGAAPMAYVLWQEFLRIAPSSPEWADRDRFVLSAGHGSMLLYSLLHLSGYPLSLEEIRNFRQLGSRTPGHPENFVTTGVETTTGPLGQGFANGVGMAIAERHLAARFNRPGFDIVDHHTYAIVSDGDLMEGISHEAASLAGHLGLGKLIYLYDDNEITIDGSTKLAYTEDATRRFEAYGWQVLSVPDGNDTESIRRAIAEARADTNRPSLIRVHTVIGYGSPSKAGTAASHGSPLGEEDLAGAKKSLGWPQEPSFYIPDDVRDHMLGIERRGRELETAWKQMLDRYRSEYPEDAGEWDRWMSGEWPADLADHLPEFEAGTKIATRAASGKVLGALAESCPNLVGGSADLTGSNKTDIKGRDAFQADNPAGSYFYFGVREHGMASICNGMALHGGLRPYCGTFLIFTDYLRPALRLSALMGVPVVYVMTHDSIGLGEDGPTHQPVEHYMAIRAIPNTVFIRPCDANETAEAWRIALETDDRPVVLALTRQGLPVLDRTKVASAGGLRQGAYVLRAAKGQPDLILIATGSEVQLALEAARRLEDDGRNVRVVSMPSWELFDAQSKAYRDSILPPDVTKRISVEAGITQGWERYLGFDGRSIGLDRFGASAPASDLFEYFGLTVDRIVAEANGMLE
ncbi:MAG: transketolase [Rhodothermales bacterium]|nr:transketolase [Rhodothermales bacterium]